MSTECTNKNKLSPEGSNLETILNDIYPVSKTFHMVFWQGNFRTQEQEQINALSFQMYSQKSFEQWCNWAALC